MSGKVGLRQRIATTGWRSRTNVAMTSTSASVPVATQPFIQSKAVVGPSGSALPRGVRRSPERRLSTPPERSATRKRPTPAPSRHGHGSRSSAWTAIAARVDVMKRLATTPTVVAREPHDSNAARAAGEWRPAIDHAGTDVRKYLSIRYTERLAEAGIERSAGSVGDSYDSALAETGIGLYRTEVIRRRGPWRNIDAVEYATLEWVGWFDRRRLLEPLGYVPPIEFETVYHRSQENPAMVAGLR
jgi:putative transposase